MYGLRKRFPGDLETFGTMDVPAGMVPKAYPSAEQCRDWARLVRRQVATLSDAKVRHHLLDIAQRYERLANSMEESNPRPGQKPIDSPQ